MCIIQGGMDMVCIMCVNVVCVLCDVSGMLWYVGGCLCLVCDVFGVCVYACGWLCECVWVCVHAHRPTGSQGAPGPESHKEPFFLLSLPWEVGRAPHH